MKNKEFKYNIVFKIGDFVIIRIKNLIRLNDIFLHQFFRNQIKIFAKVTLIKNFRNSQINSILNIFHLKLFINKSIIELFSIGCKK